MLAEGDIEQAFVADYLESFHCGRIFSFTGNRLGQVDDVKEEEDMKRQSIIDLWIPASVLLGLIVIWQVVGMAGWIPGYMLPSPIKVVQAFIEDFPLLMRHTGVTLLEAGLGLLCGVALGFLTAALMDTFEPLRKAIYPLLVISQTVPPVAIAPLLLLWFSYGIAPKVVLVIVASFFPIAVGLLDGFQAVDEDQLRLMRSMNASRWQIFRHVKLPQALGEFFSGLKIAAAYSVVGAVISEWLGGFYGLGVYMTKVRKSFGYDKMFAVILLVSVISLLLMALVKMLQYQMMPWTHAEVQDMEKQKKSGSRK